ncbi:alanine racemase [Frigidibacter albus]|nr:DSD1 family PLP-dependent enzyme [Frigidibacter albus]GGH49987.1 alanine racemase [Frigidibacter albus]
MEPGYDLPAMIGMTEAEVQTPALILDLDALEANIALMAAEARSMGVALRPHAKMHKSADIALMQIAAGAVGICCQKVSEAEALVRAGVGDVLISNEVRDGVKLARLARLAGRARVAVCVDDAGGVAELAAAVAEAGTELRVLVEVDVGAARCGVAPGGAAVPLAQAILAAPGLSFGGLQAYHGGAQHLRSDAERAAATAAVVGKVRETLAALKAAGIAVPCVSGAGTGSFRHEGASGVYTEMQCGSYAFMDADYGRNLDAGGAMASPFRNAMFVLAGVMSKTKPGHAVCDAGLKVMTMESGLPVSAREGVVYAGASDEHGTLADPGDVLRPGDRLRLIPGHCDPTVNLHDWYVGLRGGVVECLWPVTARGKHF